MDPYSVAYEISQELQQAGSDAFLFVQQHALLSAAIVLAGAMLWRWTTAPPR